MELAELNACKSVGAKSGEVSGGDRELGESAKDNGGVRKSGEEV